MSPLPRTDSLQGQLHPNRERAQANTISVSLTGATVTGDIGDPCRSTREAVGGMAIHFIRAMWRRSSLAAEYCASG
jgi:hypothetical protein